MCECACSCGAPRVQLAAYRAGDGHSLRDFLFMSAFVCIGAACFFTSFVAHTWSAMGPRTHLVLFWIDYVSIFVAMLSCAVFQFEFCDTGLPRQVCGTHRSHPGHTQVTPRSPPR